MLQNSSLRKLFKFVADRHVKMMCLQFCCVCVYFSLREMRWVYVIKGMTETAVAKDLAPATFQTQARQRTEMRLDVMLTGSVAGPKQVMKCRPLSTSDDTEPQQVIVGEGCIAISYAQLVMSVPIARCCHFMPHCRCCHSIPHCRMLPFCAHCRVLPLHAQCRVLTLHGHCRVLPFYAPVQGTATLYCHSVLNAGCCHSIPHCRVLPLCTATPCCFLCTKNNYSF